MKNGLPKLGVAAIVKNELADLREWIAFHLAVGVSHFLIADNESHDGTREYLALLESLGLVTLLEVPTVGDEKPQLGAYRELLARCPDELDLLAFIDADEYLLPLEGEAGPPSLLPWLARLFADESVGALALNWACFGSSGARFRGEGLVIERFVQRAPRTFRTNRHYKSIVRPERVTAFLNPHHVALAHGHYVNGKGQPLEPLEERPGLSRRVVWGGARVNHYIIKSVEEFLLGKSVRGSAATPGYQKGRDYFQRFDRNDKTCRLAERLAPEVHRQLLALPAERQEAERELPRRRRGALRSLTRWFPAHERARATPALPEPVVERAGKPVLERVVEGPVEHLSVLGDGGADGPYHPVGHVAARCEHRAVVQPHDEGEPGTADGGMRSPMRFAGVEVDLPPETAGRCRSRHSTIRVPSGAMTQTPPGPVAKRLPWASHFRPSVPPPFAGASFHCLGSTNTLPSPVERSSLTGKTIQEPPLVT